MLGRAKAMDLLETALSLSQAEQTEALIVGRGTRLTRYSENHVHQNVSEDDCIVTVRAVNGKRIGAASTNQIDPDSLREAVLSACAASRLAPVNPDFVGLPAPEPSWGSGPASHIGFSAGTATCPADLRAAYVERVVRVGAERGLSVAGALSTGLLEMAVANSLGMRAHMATTRADLSCVAIGSDSSGFAQESAADVAWVDPTRVAERAIGKCLASKDPVSLPPGEYDVILEPPAVGEMLDLLGYMGLTAESYQEGRSFMCGRLGEKIVGENVTLWDDGLDPAGLPIPFDVEGVPKQKVMLIERGVARGVVYDSLTAGREGRKSTGHALSIGEFRGPMPLNLVMAAGDSTLDEMIRGTRRGLLITRFHYLNPVHLVKAIFTGMTRDGTFLIEDGRIVRGVRNLRFTESITGALSRVEALSGDAVLSGGMYSVVCPAIKVRGFTFTGATE